MTFRPIAIALSPNTQARDAILASSLMLQPWRWKRGHMDRRVERWFAKRLGNQYNVAVDSGRSALRIALEALGIEPDDEILTQAFTCTAVPAALIWRKAKPVWVDIDESYNIDPIDLEQKITKRSKAIIVQNTFGVPADYDAILAIARKHHLYVIEDCAHSLGATWNDKPLGSLGDIAIFSFGRDKVISSVSGGLITTHNAAVGKKWHAITDTLAPPRNAFIAKQLFHIIFFTALVLPTYHLFSIGKVLHAIGRLLRLTTYAVTKGEKKLQQPAYMPARLSNALARIAFSQLQRLDRFNTHRVAVAQEFRKHIKTAKRYTPQHEHPQGQSIFLRYALAIKFDKKSKQPTDTKRSFLRHAHAAKLYLGDWYNGPITPLSVPFADVHYEHGSCPRAEQAAASVINLPTYPRLSPDEIKRIIKFMNHEKS